MSSAVQAERDVLNRRLSYGTLIAQLTVKNKTHESTISQDRNVSLLFSELLYYSYLDDFLRPNHICGNAFARYASMSSRYTDTVFYTATKEKLFLEDADIRP